MDTLTITAVTASGQAYDIDFPLHPLTRSSEAVGDTVTALLAAISDTVATHRALSDGDILQALAMTLAIRTRMAGGSADSMRKLVHELFDSGFAAALASPQTQAGHA
ncbi:MAG: hypothetical protein AB1593_02440 [Pseudomonadota bacterium]